MTTLEVAGRLGYSSLSHFNKLFRRHTGKSPREYRFAALNDEET
jgi:AraC-like DNA-binding protein